MWMSEIVLPPALYLLPSSKIEPVTKLDESFALKGLSWIWFRFKLETLRWWCSTVLFGNCRTGAFGCLPILARFPISGPRVGRGNAIDRVRRRRSKPLRFVLCRRPLSPSRKTSYTVSALARSVCIFESSKKKESSSINIITLPHAFFIPTFRFSPTDDV